MNEKTYNGWKNWDTWNCALWLQNDDSYLKIAKSSESFSDFKEQLLKIGKAHGMRKYASETTPDGAYWRDADYSEMDELIADLSQESQND